MGEEALARLKARPDRYAEVTGRLERHSVASLLALLDETYARTDWLADCARIRCPALIIAGAEDQLPHRGDVGARGRGRFRAPVFTSWRAVPTSRIEAIAPKCSR